MLTYSQVASISIPPNMASIIQGVKDAVVANIAKTVTNVPLIG